MLKKLLRACFFLASLVVATSGNASTISWNLPTTYSDGTPIPSSEVRQIRVKVYSSPERTGPWKWVATSLPGATSMQVMDPPPGQTLWYTVKSSLHDAESIYAEPVRKTNAEPGRERNLPSPLVQFARKVARKTFTPKKMGALLFLLLVGGLAWFLRSRGKRGNE